MTPRMTPTTCKSTLLAIVARRIRYARADADNAGGADQARYLKTWESLTAVYDELAAVDVGVVP